MSDYSDWTEDSCPERNESDTLPVIYTGMVRFQRDPSVSVARTELGAIATIEIAGAHYVGHGARFCDAISDLMLKVGRFVPANDHRVLTWHSLTQRA